MSDQTPRPYTPKPVQIPEETHAALIRAASHAHSPSLQIALDHVSFLEERHEVLTRALVQWAVRNGIDALRPSIGRCGTPWPRPSPSRP